MKIVEAHIPQKLIILLKILLKISLKRGKVLSWRKCFRPHNNSLSARWFQCANAPMRHSAPILNMTNLDASSFSIEDIFLTKPPRWTSVSPWTWSTSWPGRWGGWRRSSCKGDQIFWMTTDDNGWQLGNNGRWGGWRRNSCKGHLFFLSTLILHTFSDSFQILRTTLSINWYSQNIFCIRFEYLEQCVATTQRQFSQQRLLLEVTLLITFYHPIFIIIRSGYHHDQLRMMVKPGRSESKTKKRWRGCKREWSWWPGYGQHRHCHCQRHHHHCQHHHHHPHHHQRPPHDYHHSHLNNEIQGGSHECLSQADSACSTLSPTAAAIMEHNGFHEEIFGPQVSRTGWSDTRTSYPCQVTSFSDQEEREEPASQSEIVVEAEVRWFYNLFKGL